MHDLKVPEKKLLSDPCWIELGDDIKFRIEYQTRSQEVEQRKLQKVWAYHREQPDTEHWMSYYIRSTVREVVGFSIEGKPTTLVCERGLAKELTNGETSLDFIAVLLELDMVEAVGGMIMERLEVTELDKKKQQSQPNSSETENSTPTGSPSSQEQELSTVGTPSPQTEERTLLKRVHLT